MPGSVGTALSTSLESGAARSRQPTVRASEASRARRMGAWYRMEGISGEVKKRARSDAPGAGPPALRAWREENRRLRKETWGDCEPLANVRMQPPWGKDFMLGSRRPLRARRSPPAAPGPGRRRARV